MNLGFYPLLGGMRDLLEDCIQFHVAGPGGILTTAVVNLQPEFGIERTSRPVMEVPAAYDAEGGGSAT